jgi:hypothetical protein
VVLLTIPRGGVHRRNHLWVVAHTIGAPDPPLRRGRCRPAVPSAPDRAACREATRREELDPAP